MLFICATVIFVRNSVQQNGSFPWKKDNINYVLIFIFFDTCFSCVFSLHLHLYSLIYVPFLCTLLRKFLVSFHLCPVSFGALYISFLNNQVRKIHLDNATPFNVSHPPTKMYAVLCFLIFRFVRRIYKRLYIYKHVVESILEI